MSVRSVLNRIHKDFRPSVSGSEYKSLLRQRYEIIHLMLRGYFTPGEYYIYRFYEKGKTYRDMFQYISNSTLLDSVIPALNRSSWMQIHENKWLFNLYYSNFGIPITNVYGFYYNKGGYCKDGSPLCSASDLKNYILRNKPKTIVVKPVGGWQGKGILIIKQIDYLGDEKIQFSTVGGKGFDLDFLVIHMEKYQFHKKNPGVLLEEKLEQHSFFEELNPFTMNHMRVVTLLDYKDKPKLYLAGLRLGRKGRETANWEQGGLSISIDPDTGELGNGLQKPKYGNQWVERHPDSGVLFKGMSIPMWHDIKLLCEQIARLTPDLRMVGWDVVLTPNGPVVIEGNPIFTIEGVQIHSTERIRHNIKKDLHQFGISLPDDKHFGIHPGLLSKAFKRWFRI
jgi:hypothetical protein